MNTGCPFTITWLPFFVTGGQMARQPPVHVGLAADSPTSSYTVRLDGPTSTVPMEVDMVFRALAGSVTGGLLGAAADVGPAPDVADDEAKAARLQRYAELRWSPATSPRL